jgi:hypothetical protein
MDVPPSPPDQPPGKIRTWWHPLLVNFLRWQLGDHYRLQEEVPVGQMPLRLDILLLRQLQGELPEQVRQILAGLADQLGEFTLLEFKSPSDGLRAGDLQTFLAYSLLYRVQNDPLLAPERLHLVVLAPRMTRGYLEELRVLGVTAREEQPGIQVLEGGPVIHRTWVLETAVLAGLEHPLLTLFSPQSLAQGQQVYTQLRTAGYTEMVVYLLQQVHQFDQRGEEFAMQHLGTEDEMQQVLRNVLASLPAEQRLAGLSPEERLRGLAPEERLRGLAPEQRLQGLAPEERLRGLTPEELERLRRLLQQPPPRGDASSSQE